MLRNRLVAGLMAGALTFGSAGATLAHNDGNHGNHDDGQKHEQSKKFSDDYKDWQENFWGNESLSRLILMGILKGDGAGQIDSNKPVTRLEAAITVIRLLGLQKTNDPINLDDQDRAQTPEWGMEAVMIGLQHGFLEGGRGSLEPNKPLTRLEAAVLLVKAAGLTAEAESKTGAALPFKDTQKLSATAKGYLAIAIEKGFIRGMEDNTFKPEKPLTRAEWATMLDRLDRTEGPAVRPDGKQIKGEVVSVTTANGLAALEVKTPVYPAGVTYTFDDAALIYKERQEITLAEVTTGDHVILQLSPDRTILMLTLYTPAPTIQQVSGTVTAWTTPDGQTGGSITYQTEGGEPKTLPVATNASVKLGDRAGALSDLRLGDQVQMTVTNGAVTALSIKVAKGELIGTLKAVTPGTTAARPQVTIEYGTPTTSKTFEVVDWAELRKDGSPTPITLADLAVGQKVKLTYERTEVSKILVLKGVSIPGQLLTGKVMTWAAPTASAEGSLVLNTNGAEMRLLTVLKTATVTLNESPATLADVLVGDTATVSLTDGKVTAVKLQATAQEMTGTLTAVAVPSAGARAQLTFLTGNPATTQSLTVAPWATYRRQGSNAALTIADLVAGSSIKLTVLHGLVTKVEILVPATTGVSGQVMTWIAPTASADGNIVIGTGGAEMKLLPVAPTATVTLGDNPVTLADVKTGDMVVVTVTNGKATKINLQATAQEMVGALTAVAAPSGGARAQLTFQTGDPATTKSLAVAPWASFKKQGSDAAITLADLVVGSSMKLTVVHNLITKVEVLTLPPKVETVSGQVMAWIAPTTSPGSVALTVNGQMVLFPVAKVATVTLNGHAVGFSDVQVGDAVTLTVTDNAVTAIQVTAAETSMTGTLKAVTAATAAARAQLTIESGSPASNQTLTVAPWADVKLQGSDAAITLADMLLNSTVELKVSHGLIVAIKVTALPAPAGGTGSEG